VALLEPNTVSGGVTLAPFVGHLGQTVGHLGRIFLTDFAFLAVSLDPSIREEYSYRNWLRFVDGAIFDCIDRVALVDSISNIDGGHPGGIQS